MLKYLRWLLLPLSWLYGSVIVIRNLFYNRGIFKSKSFNIPVISIGNLDVGGAGKSPMAEYLIRLLKADRRIATLSRGYGRKTSGFMILAPATTAADAGDEPVQFKQKFADITVAVNEDRAEALHWLSHTHDVVIMDDAYQHRAVRPGLSILLFDHDRILGPQLMLPAGNLREPFSGRNRADIIIITKCPAGITSQQMIGIRNRIKPGVNQELFFSTISYSALQDVDGNASDANIDSGTVVFLLTGIANAAPLLNHVKTAAKQVVHHNYPDHHRFTLKNIAKLAAGFDARKADKKLIVTTEKDIQRLREHHLLSAVKQLPFLVMPIQVSFLEDGGDRLDKIIKTYVR